MQKVLIVNGHPDTESFNYALHQAYKTGAQLAGKDIKEISLATMTFTPNLQFGYRKRTELEPDMVAAWDKIQWADHIVWIFPIWWATMPALLKGFLDRLFLPRFAFEYQEKSAFPKPLLKGKTSEIICTMNTPVWYYKYVLGNRGIKLLSKSVLDFCGIKNKRTTYLAVIRNSTEPQRKTWLKKVEQIGKN